MGCGRDVSGKVVDAIFRERLWTRCKGEAKYLIC